MDLTGKHRYDTTRLRKPPTFEPCPTKTLELYKKVIYVEKTRKLSRYFHKATYKFQIYSFSSKDIIQNRSNKKSAKKIISGRSLRYILAFKRT